MSEPEIVPCEPRTVYHVTGNSMHSPTITERTMVGTQEHWTGHARVILKNMPPFRGTEWKLARSVFADPIKCADEAFELAMGECWRAA